MTNPQIRLFTRASLLIKTIDNNYYQDAIFILGRGGFKLSCEYLIEFTDS